MQGQVFATDLWRMIVNLHKNKPGKLMVCLMGHDEDVCALADSELLKLGYVIR